jgi:hypothetical protein
MGDDFSSHRLFAGNGDPSDVRKAAIAQVRQFFQQAGFAEVADESEAERSLVVGPARRWLFLGDSAGSTEWVDLEGFNALSQGLSVLGPVVDTKMSDAATVHFYLYKHGRLEDKFGNAAFPFYRFASEEEAAPFRGKPELWADLLVDPGQVGALRAAWAQDWQASEILASTARLFGWGPDLLWLGYTLDEEGIPIKYDQFLGRDVHLGQFEELHFAQLRGS